jgi:WhiB family redox-sensing transcriptional regulator
MGVAVLEWQDKAACSGMNRDWFFPEPDVLPAPEAAAACRRCSVRDECLAWALETGQEFGIWGGLTEEQRRKISTTRSRVRCPDCRSESIIDLGRSEVCLACGLSWPV